MDISSKILTFILFMSIINILKHGFNIIVELRKEEPQELKYSKTDLWLLGGSVSYILTILFTGL